MKRQLENQLLSFAVKCWAALSGSVAISVLPFALLVVFSRDLATRKWLCPGKCADKSTITPAGDLRWTCSATFRSTSSAVRLSILRLPCVLFFGTSWCKLCLVATTPASTRRSSTASAHSKALSFCETLCWYIYIHILSAALLARDSNRVPMLN